MTLRQIFECRLCKKRMGPEGTRRCPPPVMGRLHDCSEERGFVSTMGVVELVGWRKESDDEHESTPRESRDDALETGVDRCGPP